MIENTGSDFTEKGTQMANKCMERCSTSLSEKSKWRT